MHAFLPIKDTPFVPSVGRSPLQILCYGYWGPTDIDVAKSFMKAFLASKLQFISHADTHMVNEAEFLLSEQSLSQRSQVSVKSF